MAGCIALIASMVLFLLARGAYWQIVIAMTVDGFGDGCVYAVNPRQITGGVPAAETGCARGQLAVRQAGSKLRLTRRSGPIGLTPAV